MANRRLVCGLCDSVTDFAVPQRCAHIAILHAVLNHAVPLPPLQESVRRVSPSGRASWWLPDGREWLIEWANDGFRL